MTFADAPRPVGKRRAPELGTWRGYLLLMRFQLAFMVVPAMVLWSLGATFIGRPPTRHSRDGRLWIPARFPDEGWYALWDSFRDLWPMPVLFAVINGVVFLLFGVARLRKRARQSRLGD